MQHGRAAHSGDRMTNPEPSEHPCGPSGGQERLRLRRDGQVTAPIVGTVFPRRRGALPSSRRECLLLVTHITRVGGAEEPSKELYMSTAGLDFEMGGAIESLRDAAACAQRGMSQLAAPDPPKTMQRRFPAGLVHRELGELGVIGRHGRGGYGGKRHG